MRTLIAGGDPRLAFEVARDARSRGHEVALLVPDEAEGRALADVLNVPVVVGPASDPEVMRQIEAWRADVLVAIADEDPVNLVACQVARRMFGISRTVALVHDPDSRELFECLGVGPVISAAEVLGSLIEEQSVGVGVLAHLALSAGRLVVLEVKLPPEAPAVGHRLEHVPLPAGALVVGIVRDGGPLRVPSGSLILAAGDELFVFGEAACEAEVIDVLTGPRP